MKSARLIALLLIVSLVIFIALVTYVGWGINETVQRDRSNVPENIGE